MMMRKKIKRSPSIPLKKREEDMNELILPPFLRGAGGSTPRNVVRETCVYTIVIKGEEDNPRIKN
jgi:hypothetical protein